MSDDDFLSQFGFEPYSEEFYIPLEFDDKMFDYMDSQGVDISFKNCESYDDYLMWYSKRYPDYGEDIWKMLSLNMVGIKPTKQGAREGVRKWAKSVKADESRMIKIYKEVEIDFK